MFRIQLDFYLECDRSLLILNVLCMQMEIDESSTTDGGSSSDEELDWRDQKLFS